MASSSIGDPRPPLCASPRPYASPAAAIDRDLALITSDWGRSVRKSGRSAIMVKEQPIVLIIRFSLSNMVLRGMQIFAAIVAGFFLFGVDAWIPGRIQKRVVATGVALALPISGGLRSAFAADYKQELAVKQCARVYHSLQNIYDDIEKNGADAMAVRKQVSLVEKNYSLRDNIQVSR